MDEFLLFSIFRSITRLYRVNEAEPSATPYVIGFVVVLWVMGFAVKIFTKWINRK